MIDQLRSLVASAVPLGPAAFVAAYAVLTVALVPGTIPSLAAGALFGPVWGSLLVIAGATAGAVGAFEVARRIGVSGRAGWSVSGSCEPTPGCSDAVSQG